MAHKNITVPYEPPQWNSAPAWKLPGWGEPVVSLANALSRHHTDINEDGGEYFSCINGLQQETRLSHFG
jgi:hypothetical protein